ncbi:MAG: alpha-ribazole phosphatase [Bacillota bacterium]
MGTKLILARHGETNWNKESRFQGNKNIKLNQTGIAQAKKLATRLADIEIDAIYSSTLDRSNKTAQIVAKKHDLEVDVKADLQEINFGVWEGLTFKQIESKYQDEFKLWKSNPAKNKPAEGESLTDVQDRVFNTIDELLVKHQGQTILIVAHGGVNRVLISNFLGMPLDKCWRLNQNNTAINILNIYQSEIILELFNSAYHLESN